MPTKGKEPSRGQTGSSLLEVMLSSALLATGLLALAALATAGLRDLAHARDHQLAALLARDFAGRVHLLGAPEQWPAEDRNTWQQQLARTLPQGRGTWCQDGTTGDGTPAAPSCDGAGGLRLKLFWRRSEDQGWQRLERALEP